MYISQLLLGNNGYNRWNFMLDILNTIFYCQLQVLISLSKILLQKTIKMKSISSFNRFILL